MGLSKVSLHRSILCLALKQPIDKEDSFEWFLHCSCLQDEKHLVLHVIYESYIDLGKIA